MSYVPDYCCTFGTDNRLIDPELGVQPGGFTPGQLLRMRAQVKLYKHLIYCQYADAQDGCDACTWFGKKGTCEDTVCVLSV